VLFRSLTPGKPDTSPSLTLRNALWFRWWLLCFAFFYDHRSAHYDNNGNGNPHSHCVRRGGPLRKTARRAQIRAVPRAACTGCGQSARASRLCRSAHQIMGIRASRWERDPPQIAKAAMGDSHAALHLVWFLIGLKRSLTPSPNYSSHLPAGHSSPERVLPRGLTMRSRPSTRMDTVDELDPSGSDTLLPSRHPHCRHLSKILAPRREAASDGHLSHWSSREWAMDIGPGKTQLLRSLKSPTRRLIRSPDW